MPGPGQAAEQVAAPQVAARMAVMELLIRLQLQPWGSRPAVVVVGHSRTLTERPEEPVVLS